MSIYFNVIKGNSAYLKSTNLIEIGSFSVSLNSGDVWLNAFFSSLMLKLKGPNGSSKYGILLKTTGLTSGGFSTLNLIYFDAVFSPMVITDKYNVTSSNT